MSSLLRFALLALTTLSALAHAQALPPSTHPWVTSNPRLDTYAWFSNLEQGAQLESPFLVRFGLTGIGIAAIKQPVARTGHHHLLVDRDLPLDFTEPLPFNDQYIHFGKGQMEAILDLPEGEHTLRLVFADHKHIPNFVYSEALKIKVTGKSGKTVADLQNTGVSILSPKADSRVRGPFPLVLHASGFNISHTDITEPRTGHFRVRLTPTEGEAAVIDLTQGETELWLRPPAGRYTVQTELVSNEAPDTLLATSPRMSFQVVTGR